MTHPCILVFVLFFCPFSPSHLFLSFSRCYSLSVSPFTVRVHVFSITSFLSPIERKMWKHSAIAGVLPDTPYVRNYLTQLVILFLYLCYSPFLCVSSVVTFPCQCFSRLALVFALPFTVSPSFNTSFPPPSPFPDIVVLFFHGPWNRVICWMFPLHSILRRNRLSNKLLSSCPQLCHAY